MKKSFFYYGYFPKDETGNVGSDKTKKHNNSIFRIDKARKCGFDVRTKETKMIPHYDEDGKFRGKFPKCNFDVEMTMDMIMNLDGYDTVMLFSGDSDFGGLLKHLKSCGKKVVIVCTRNRMSNELEEVANKFVPAETPKGVFEVCPHKQRSALAGGGINTIPTFLMGEDSLRYVNRISNRTLKSTVMCE